MRKAIFETIPTPIWAKNDLRYRKLDELDRYLDGEIYDHFDHIFYDEEVNGRYIKVQRRRPSVRFNVYNALADMIARDVFAGFNAPMIQHSKEKVRGFYEAIKEETEILSHMIELTNWATVGSSVATFKVVPFGEGKAKAVLRTWRSKDCTPFFNELNELATLRVHYVVSGSELLSLGVEVGQDGKPLKYNRNYWFVRDYGPQQEVTYYPIPEEKWQPRDVRSAKLEPALAHDTALDFVPAHWFRRRTGKVRPYDGRCVWEHAIPLVIEFDYSMSMMGAGLRYNAAPQVVIKGAILNAGDDGRFIGGPSRYLHFNADRSSPDGEFSESGSDAHLLEATGNGMSVAIQQYAPLLKELIAVVMCGSRKDPNKITTAMSAKGMEVLDKEYNNLIQEFRTVCGDIGYVKLLKKIGAACVLAKHPLAEGITVEDLDGLTLKWPPINPVGAQEFLYLCQGAVALLQAGEASEETNGPVPSTADGETTADASDSEPKEPIMTRQELRDYILGSIDPSINSSNRDYLLVAEQGDQLPLDPAPLTEEEKDSARDEYLAIAAEGVKAAQRGPADTRLGPGG